MGGYSLTEIGCLTLFCPVDVKQKVSSTNLAKSKKLELFSRSLKNQWWIKGINPCVTFTDRRLKIYPDKCHFDSVKRQIDF